MTPKLLEAMYTQADRMKVGMARQLIEVFGDDDPQVQVTGMVFRPADPEEEEEEEGVDWVFIAYFYAENSPTVGNVTMALKLQLGCENSDEASALFIAKVNQ